MDELSNNLLNKKARMIAEQSRVIYLEEDFGQVARTE